MDFQQTDGRYSIAPASTRHLGISEPGQLACKRSNSQPPSISHNILPCTRSRFHFKSKEVRFDTSPEIRVYKDEISDTTEYTTRPSRFITSDYQTVSLSDSSFGMKFPFSFGQTQCNSRLRSPRQTALTTVSNVSFICLESSHSST